MSQHTTLTAIPTSSSALWAAEVRAAAIGSPWSDDATHCVLCGADVNPGDRAAAISRSLFNDMFNYKQEVKHDGNAVCGHCMALWTPEWMGRRSKAFVVQGMGVFSLSGKEDIAAFVLGRPVAPYVAIFNTRKQAPLIWRTPVALPSNYLQVRIDDDLIVIDRARAMQGARAWQDACGILTDLGRPKAQPILLQGAYNLQSMSIGLSLKDDAEAVAAHGAKGKRAMEVLRSLTMGEMWALIALRDIDMDQPEAWPRYVTFAQADERAARRKAGAKAGAPAEDTSPADSPDADGSGEEVEQAE